MNPALDPQRPHRPHRLDGPDRRESRKDSLGSPFALALLMHVALFGGMTLVVQWRTQPQAPIVAELWAAVPATTTPEPVAPPPPPPPPRPQPEPEAPKADIATQQQKAPPPPPKQPEVKKEEPRKPEKKAEEKKKVEERKAEQPKAPPSDLARLMAQAGSTATPAAASSGVRGADADHAGRIIGCIRPHLVYVVPEGTPPSVYAEFQVELLPDASLAGLRLVRSSNLPGFDAAAERAIRRCDPFPRDREGRIPRTVDVRLNPVEAR